MTTTIIFNFIFGAFLALANGWIAKNLEQTTVNDQRLNTIFKSQWHNYGMLPLRVTTPLMFAFLIALFTNGFTNPEYGGWWTYIYSGFVRMGVAGLSIQFISYDSIVDMARGRFTFRYVATCEGKWDIGDCFWLKLQEMKLKIGEIELYPNHLVIKAIIIVVINYFFS